MRKFLLIISCLVVAFASFGTIGNAQEPAPQQIDLGETNLLNLSCSFVYEFALNEGIKVKNCRRHAPGILNGNKATETIKLNTDIGKFVIEIKLRKSLWWVENAILVEE